jgi:hypothetical protein
VARPTARCRPSVVRAAEMPFSDPDIDTGTDPD